MLCEFHANKKSTKHPSPPTLDPWLLPSLWLASFLNVCGIRNPILARALVPSGKWAYRNLWVLWTSYICCMVFHTAVPTVCSEKGGTIPVFQVPLHILGALETLSRCLWNNWMCLFHLLILLRVPLGC